MRLDRACSTAACRPKLHSRSQGCRIWSGPSFDEVADALVAPAAPRARGGVAARRACGTRRPTASLIGLALLDALRRWLATGPGPRSRLDDVQWLDAVFRRRSWRLRCAGSATEPVAVLATRRTRAWRAHRPRAVRGSPESTSKLPAARHLGDTASASSTMASGYDLRRRPMLAVDPSRSQAAIPTSPPSSRVQARMQAMSECRTACASLLGGRLDATAAADTGRPAATLPRSPVRRSSLLGRIRWRRWTSPYSNGILRMDGSDDPLHPSAAGVARLRPSATWASGARCTRGWPRRRRIRRSARATCRLPQANIADDALADSSSTSRQRACGCTRRDGRGRGAHGALHRAHTHRGHRCTRRTAPRGRWSSTSWPVISSGRQRSSRRCWTHLPRGPRRAEVLYAGRPSRSAPTR